MARPWRLRHKLVLLLGLVLAAVGLLLAGTVTGLTAYRTTTALTRDKTAELQIVFQLQETVNWVTRGVPDLPAEPTESRIDFEKRQALAAVEKARFVLTGYQSVLDGRPGGSTEPNQEERRQLADIRTELAAVEQTVTLAAAGGSVSGAADQPLVGPGTPAGQRHAKLVSLVSGLHGFLIADIEASVERSRAAHDRALAVAGTAAALALLLVGTLLHYFRVWVFAPVGRLQAGVRRVRAGDFDQPIHMQSDDELAELGDEFDAMTARLKEVNTDLKRQVSERTRQLVRSEKMVSVGFLAAGVAHEINNPLASIAFCSEALDGRLKGLLGRAPAGEAEVVFKYLGMMQEEAQRCKDITHRLLDFARGGGQREPADLTQIVRGVVDMTALTPNARGKEVRFADPGPVPCVVSAQEIKSVVLNIVVNALDSMDPGGRLDIRLTARGEAAELTFTDTGCGMSPETLGNIFEPFFTRSKTGQGTGLGLSISHQIIDQHGGAVTAASPGPGKGSTFVVRLPLTKSVAPVTLPFPAQKVAA